MGSVQSHPPVLLMLMVFSRHAELLPWSARRAAAEWGPVALESEPLPFEETRYYEKSMGPDLTIQLLAFERLVDPADLASFKLRTNQWEEECQREGRWPEERPINLDPGYLTQAKLVLATTKDRDHRIYLREGIFAEVTLAYSGGAWQPRPWTYPNYRRVEYHQFLVRCREHFRHRLAAS